MKDGYSKLMTDGRSVQFLNNLEPEQTAKEAGLRYVHDEDPGIRRRRAKRSFWYEGPDGKKITDRETLDRIRSLVLPPAWRDVWICPLKNGHLQATGRDARGRKQYRYHPKWREFRDRAKFDRTIAFGRALPKLRARIERDLSRRALSRERVLAAVTRLLERSLIRIGNEEYERENGSFGLTTMRTRHAELKGAKIRFQFRAKGGKLHRVTLRSQRLTRIIRRCQELPGQRLFQFLDDDGNPHPVNSEDVNAYIREATGGDFTAKDFRTWAGTFLAATALCGLEPPSGKTQAKKQVVQAVEHAAKKLGNTPAICRKGYIHPGVIESYLDGNDDGFRKLNELRFSSGDPAAAEAVLLELLESGSRKRLRKAG